MKVFEMFSGFGGASFALKKAGIDFECVGYSEIDRFAIQCYEQNHNNQEYPDAMGNFSEPIKNYGDCTKINPNKLPDFDLLTGGFPCQSFSVAGKGQGEQDTRGTLFNDIIRIAEIKKPRYILLENVKGLTTKRHAATFQKILSELQRIGYQVEWKVLNSKEHGIPQNRERVFFVCWNLCKMNFIEFCNFKFPEKEELEIFLKDILEKEVDEKYYLKNKQTKKLLSTGWKQKEISNTIRSGGRQSLNKKHTWDIVQVGMINQTCQKRIHNTPKEINEFLREYKLPFTLQQIADKINIPKTQVEHYFRLDKSRAIPSPESWDKLKEFLNFPDTYDKQVTEIYEKEIKFESTRRVYSDKGCSPTISSTNADKIIQINNPTHSNNRVYSDEGVSPSLNTMQGGHRQPFIVASRGRNPENPSDRTAGNKVEQRLEPKFDGTSNTISTVQKDNYVGEPAIIQRPRGFNKGGLKTECPTINSNYWQQNNFLFNNCRIRKLSPTECFRLMGFLDDQINLEGLSNTQRYKLAGNGFEINLVSKIFKEMFK